MEQNKLLNRIELNPKIMAGKPVIKGTRLTVQHILNLLAHKTTIDEILSEYPGLTSEDVLACLLYASAALEDITFMPLGEAV
jgi:uncharacterized protein (DUF433 family)